MIKNVNSICQTKNGHRLHRKYVCLSIKFLIERRYIKNRKRISKGHSYQSNNSQKRDLDLQKTHVITYVDNMSTHQLLDSRKKVF